MINLIPPVARKELLVEYWIRVVSVWAIVWAIALFAATSILLPTYVLVNLQTKAQQASAAEASQQVANYETVSVALVQASQQARIIMDEVQATPLSEYLALFSKLQDAEIQFSGITLGRTEAGPAPATIEGIASDRQALASFRDRLLTDERVEAVDLPISHLAQGKDIPFSITITLVNPNVP